ncbi:MAG: cobalamin ABC transporter substrate-binding protein [Byssovorax sp.]
MTAPVLPRRAVCAGLRAGLLAATLLLAGGAGPGCGGEPTPGAQTPGPAGPLPVWEGRGAQLFDDTIDPAAVGLSLDGPTGGRSDPNLRDRAKEADIVARVKVQTVTLDTMGEQEHYHLNLLIGRPAFAQPRIPDSAVEIEIRTKDPAFGLVKSFDARLRDKTFIGFLRRFQGADGEAHVHFHLSADTESVAAAVKEAVALQELSGT